MMLNRPYHFTPTSTYWTGVTRKKLQTRAAWSARAVGLRVTNSRSARNDMSANRTTEPMPPLVAQVVETAPELRHLLARASRPLREEDQRVLCPEAFNHPRDRLLAALGRGSLLVPGPRTGTIDQNSLEDPARQVATDGPSLPIVARRDRSRPLPQALGQ